MDTHKLLNILTTVASFSFIIILLVPIVYSVYSSFQIGKIGSRITSLGLGNYISVIENPEVSGSLLFGSAWAFATVGLQTLVGIALALLLNQSFKGRAIIRSFLFIPYVIPVTVVAAIWRWLLSDMSGLLNMYLSMLGVRVASWWSPSIAPLSLTLVSVWAFSPFVMLCALAGLQGIPHDLYDSANIDGASSIQCFRHVTLPFLRDVLFITILLRIIWMFNKFDLIWVLTGGGPLGATQNLPILAYRLTFLSLNFGQGSAASNILMIIITLLAFIYFKVYKI